MINVQQYGAKGNGVADDTAALQQALNEQKSVYVPAGEYVISDTLIVPTGARLYGEGVYATKIIQTQNGIPILRVTGSHYAIERMYLLFINQQTEAMSGGIGIELGDAATGAGAFEGTVQYVNIEKCFRGLAIPTWTGQAFAFQNTFRHIRVVDHWDYGFYLASNIGITTNTLMNCYVLAQAHQPNPQSKGYYMSNHDDFVLMNCAVDHVAQEALTVENCRGGTVLNFHVEENRVRQNYRQVVHVRNSRAWFSNLQVLYTIFENIGAEAYLVYVSGTSEVMIEQYVDRDETVINSNRLFSLVKDATSVLKIGSRQSNLPLNMQGKYRDRDRTFQSPSVPTVGNWERGDVIWNEAPSPGGHVGWVCVQSGSAPGQALFRPFGRIES